ncbi:nuclear transport factor 2 family protein [Aestuariicoccus sp. MJ-SS9]|uniref:nuclear transport factor 2 family protein n=1 Tax=Aestuariicoccus sp. MJ-SS9 TaxID=3079855 RepID=UPI0029068524|nr:nuclear transport factor 2 family protein [Aestuariicoccus sp. MJ-SS9]MDU8914180.1 nuclear transport factor 2 family protein [Aestuariicoccus sp. MJ-SS9]
MTHTSLDLAQIAKAYAQAWSSKSPEAVAAFYAPNGQIEINGGPALKGRAAIAEMAAGFYAAYPDLVVHCEELRAAGDHAVFAWSLEGHHAETGSYVRLAGWEEWDLDPEGRVQLSKGWFDAEDERRQIGQAA